MDEDSARSENTMGLQQHALIVRRVGVNHDGDHRWQALVRDREMKAVGSPYREPRSGVLEHLDRDIDPDWVPSEAAHPAGVDARTTADLEARAPTGSEQLGDGLIDTDRVGVRGALGVGPQRAEEFLFVPVGDVVVGDVSGPGDL